LVDRFYGSAMVSPATTFPRLLRMAQPYLSTLRNDTWYMSYMDKDLAQLLSEPGLQFPRTLTLVEQGDFSLGFFFQRAHLFAPRQKNGEAFDVAPASVADEDRNEEPRTLENVPERSMKR